MLSRGFYNHMIPIFLRHYRHPLSVKDIPALREDDTAAVSLANWRLAEKRRQAGASKRWNQDSFKEIRSKGDVTSPPNAKRSLAFRLLWHFRKEFLRQTVSRGPL
jgi:hypothetical protein